MNASSVRATARRARTWSAAPTVVLAQQLFVVDPVRALVLTALVGAAGALPAVVAVANGYLVGTVSGSDALLDGAVVAALVSLAVAFLCLQIVAPLVNLLADALGRRVGDAVRERLIRAMTRSADVGPLDDPNTANQLAVAQGAAGASVGVNDAVVALANITLLRTQAVVSGLVLLWFDVWVAVFLVLAYLTLTLLMAAEYREQQRAAYGDPDRLRRASYIRDLALSGDAAKEVRIFGLTGWLEEQFRSQWSPGVGRAWFGASTRRVLPAAAAVAAVHALAYARLGLAVASGEISFGQFVTFATAVTGVAAVVALTMDLLNLGAGARPVAACVELERVLGGDEPAPVVPTSLPEGEIRFEGVGFRYPGSRRWVIRGLDLVIRRGETLAIVGFNGAGKTTVVKLLCQLHQPVEGRITVGGTDLRELDARAWQRDFAVIFQHFNHYPLSLAENIGLGAPGGDQTSGSIEISAALAGAGHLAAGLEHGYDTVLSRRYPGGTDLSGGQWQRVAIARAVHAVRSGASFLVLDEPTAALDARAEARFYEEVMTQVEVPATILISHRFATIRRADRIVVFEDGQVLEDGTHEELMDVGGSYARMFTIQAERFGVS
ncbi:ABC transporter ATP-binding protein [Kineosporia sp. NBRC 101731]|uniref:ABC transporter ATP-binding protein n=1 Tax=Kineosporia sp. NBRC 101731 TaxID=3032199 RepID=UPI0024A1EA24|nr:ABC transporter ATP-binding protein [Kineosporia sp. NBRC 101731]GLY30842.1 multidrug ABC transporter permease [Kineosporia sp. NBRC 101731]